TSTAGAGTHTIKASYSANDSRHTNSADTLGVGLTVTKRTTSTGVSCSPNPITYGGSSSCTVTVTDTDAGTKSAPSGTVTFDKGTASGTFSATTCSLVAGSTSSSCSVTYTPTAVGSGSHTITGSYGGSAAHAAGSGNTSLGVNKAV